MIDRLHVPPQQRICLPCKVYHAPGVNIKDGRRLMELPCLCATELGLMYGSRSLVRIDGSWHREMPYHAWSGGPHRFRRLSPRLQRQIRWIDRLGRLWLHTPRAIQRWITWAIPV